ncbi:MAG: cupin domain-containing protein [Rhodobacteraceae bacterium]|nr:cupin domain-containing protein [Paracoccaceae bacterium]
MAILRKGSVAEVHPGSSYPDPYNLGSGNLSYRHLTEAGGLTQFGAALETLHPGGQSSQMHWEDGEDEFLYMLSGEITVIENGAATVIGPGDACTWKAGTPVAHCLRNHTEQPATYLIVGTRNPANITHYPGLDMLATPTGYTRLDGTPYPKRET